MKASGSIFTWGTLLFVLISSCSLISYAQTDPNLENGFKPYGTYSGSNIDSINLMNGNLLLHIPMPFGLPQRGKIQPSYFLGISSKQWGLTCSGGTSCSWYPAFFFQQAALVPAARGTGVGFDNSMDLIVTREYDKTVDDVDPGMNSYVEALTGFNTADGSNHRLLNVGLISTSGTYISPDLTGYQIIESNPDSNGIFQAVSVRDRAGNVYNFGGWANVSCKVTITPDNTDPNHPGTITTSDCKQAAQVTSVTDTNGNTINFGGQDTMGRSITLQGLSGTQSTTDYSGCVSPASQPISSATIANYMGFNGATNQVKICYTNISLSTNFGASGVSEYPGSLQEPPLPVIVTVILLADNSTWSFQYDSYGNVTYLGLPLGGNIQYQWETVVVPSPGARGSRAVSKRTITDNNGNSYVWNYQYGSGSYPNSYTNIMTDPLNNDTANTFSTLGGVNNDFNDVLSYFAYTTKIYQGSHASGTLLKQEDLQYYNNGQSGNSNVVSPFVTKITITLNGKVSQVTRTPDGGAFGSSYPLGLVMAEKKYDFGSGQPGVLINEADTTYVWQGTSTSAQQYLAANLIGLPASVQVKDGNGNVCAETDTAYDDPNRLMAFTGVIPNHGAAPNVVRGNLTSAGRKLTTSACSVGSSTPSVTSYTNWYDTGEVYQAIDPLGNTTATHTYDLAYYGAYSTQTCNAASQCVSGTYDFNTGLLTSFTNANATRQASGNIPGDAAHTTMYSYDVLSRMTQATFPPDPGNNNAPAVAQFNYPVPLTLPFVVTKTKSVTMSSTDSVTTTYDGLGRPYKTVHTSAGNATVITTYDGLSHVATVTNPYFSASDPTYGITQTQYDALGRATKTTKADGSVATMAYEQLAAVSGNSDCTLATDEAGKVRVTYVDGLARLVEVDEPSNTGIGSSAATPATGSVSISGSDPSTYRGSVSISGSEGFTTVNPCLPKGNCPIRKYDTGAVGFSINGISVSTSYGQASTATGIASTLVSQFNGTSVTATVDASNPAQIDLVAGGGVSYSAGSGGDFRASFNGASLGSDSGNVTVSINGTAISASYAAGSTAASVAAQLVQNINTTTSLVTASVPNGGTTITLTAITPGAAGNSYSLSAHVANQLTPAAFSVSTSGSTLSGGVNIKQPYVTLYNYDALGNLIQINQKADGSQAARVRTFTYDSLSRLLTANNPESGQISYGYDADGNMLQKTSPAPNQTGSATQTLSYCYDALNRVTGKAYSAQTCSNGQLPASTAVVRYIYDAGSNGIGHLTSLTDQAGSGSYSFDVLGRMAGEQRTIASVSKSISYGYNLNGSVKSVTYPSGRVVNYAVDSAGRALSAVDANGTSYVASTSYNAAGDVTGLVNGNNGGSSTAITNSFQYNQRLQLCRITALTSGALPTSCTDNTNTANLLDRGYNYNVGTSDNGQVMAITNYRDGTRSQSFAYDGLNRLASASSQANTGTFSWGENYTIDPWGNLQISPVAGKAGGGNFQYAADANNHLVGMSYDAAGNLLAYGSTNYTYDPENRLQAITGGISYTYDAEGARVLKSQNGSATNTYWLGSGDVLAEGNGAGNLTAEYVYFGGKRVARIDLAANTVHYYLTDHLRSTAMAISSSGGIEQDSDFSPFGTEYTATSGPNHYKFTGKERDAESGLDYFGARHYGSMFGRFLTPDWSASPATVPYAHLDNPQTLNLYGYVDNNPINGIDPDGHSPHEYMVDPVGSWGPNFFSTVSGDVELTLTDVTLLVASETNSVTVIGVQTSSITQEQADILSSPAPGIGPAMTGFGAAQISSALASKPKLDNGAAIPGGLGPVNFLVFGRIPGWISDLVSVLGGASGSSTAQFANGVTAKELRSAAGETGGETMRLYTNLTRAPQAGRGLSTAGGEGAEAFVSSWRSDGQVFSGNIPVGLFRMLDRAGLVRATWTMNKDTGHVIQELRFRPEATEYILKFFEPLK